MDKYLCEKSRILGASLDENTSILQPSVYIGRLVCEYRGRTIELHPRISSYTMALKVIENFSKENKAYSLHKCRFIIYSDNQTMITININSQI